MIMSQAINSGHTSVDTLGIFGINMKESIITQLTRVWYSLVGLDHHKDRDCHWSININYDYGDPPVFVLYHDGYVYYNSQLEKETYSTYEDAENGLIDYLVDAIQKEKDWADHVLADNPDNWEQCQVTNARTILKIKQ